MPDPAAEDRAAGPLAATLHAESFADSVRFNLQVTNTATAPVSLTFPTGQSFDFEVQQGERVIWRWSDDQMFTQAVRHETLAPGETRRYQATWAPAPERRGEFQLRGYLTAQEHRVEQQTRFRFR